MYKDKVKEPIIKNQDNLNNKNDTNNKSDINNKNDINNKKDINNKNKAHKKSLDESLKVKINPKGKANRNAQNSVNRIAAIAIFTLLQIVVLGLMLYEFSNYSIYFQIGFGVLSIIIVLTIYGRHTNSANKMPWMIFIMCVPVFGILLYLLMGRPTIPWRSKSVLKRLTPRSFLISSLEGAFLILLK